MTLSYLHPSDFSLYQPVAKIHTNDLQQAVSQLSAAYTEQGVLVTASNNQIVVRAAQAAGIGPASDTSAAAASP